MRIARWMLSAVLAVVPLGVFAAEGSGLHALQTMDAARGWEAVGRLDIGGTGFCTGALIAPDLVLTAGHCLFDKRTGERVDPRSIEFLAGWRNGRAAAYRQVRRAVVHQGFDFDGARSAGRVRNDLALLELDRPIRNTSVSPFATAERPRRGEAVGIVSYAHDRAEAPSLEEVCDVLARKSGVLVTSCSVDFGSSGAPIFSFGENGEPRIVSVVSAKAELDGQKVALGTEIDGPLEDLKARLDAGAGSGLPPAPRTNRIQVGKRRHQTGAKFVRP
ncbi:MAG: trypsin-like serine peptidase [Marinibacterium sp.]